LSNKKLHILFLTGWYPSRVLPINGDFVQRHAEAVATQHRVSVVHVITDPSLQTPYEIQINHTDSLTEYIGFIKKTLNPFYKLYLFFQVYTRIFKKIDPYDLIHVNKLYPSGIVALVMKFFRSKSFLITEHWSGYQQPQCSQIPLIEKSISKLIAKKASYICPVSAHLGESMRAFGLKGRYQPVPNVVMTNIFVPKRKKQHRLTLLHVSSLYDEVKNITGILNTLGNLKKQGFDFFTYFVGGPDTTFKKTIQKNNLNGKDIQFIDFVSQKDLAPYLQQSDALLLFSHYENLPCVILEAFSSGLPVIATNVGGISEYFPDDFGILIPANDEKKLALAIQSVSTKQWATPDAMHQYALANFSPKKIATDFDELYKKMAN